MYDAYNVQHLMILHISDISIDKMLEMLSLGLNKKEKDNNLLNKFFDIFEEELKIKSVCHYFEI